jgi:DNA repair exonuclease SbcCD ATPase subunit
MPFDKFLEFKSFQQSAGALTKKVVELERALALAGGGEIVRAEMVAEHTKEVLLKDEMIVGLRKQLAAFEAQAKKDSVQRKKLSDELAAIQTRGASLETELAAVRAELAKKSAETPAAVKAAKQALSTELQGKIQALERELQAAQLAIKEKEAARLIAQKRVDTESASHAAELSSVRSELSTLRGSKQTIVEAHGKELSTLRAEIASLTERLAKQASEHESEKAASAASHTVEVEALRSEIDRLNAAIHTHGAEGGGSAEVLATLHQQHAETSAVLQQVSQQNLVLQSQLMNLLAMWQSSQSMPAGYPMMPASGAYMVPVTAMPAPVAYGSMVPPHQFSASAPSYTAEAAPAATTPVAHGAHVLHSSGGGRGKAKRHHGPTTPAGGAEPSRL